jgi:hypothetical protein
MYFTNYNRPFFRFRLRNRSLFAALAFSTLFFNAAGALADTVTVTSAEDSGAGTLRQAILDAASGDTINFSLPSGATAITLTSDRGAGPPADLSSSSASSKSMPASPSPA